AGLAQASANCGVLLVIAISRVHKHDGYGRPDRSPPLLRRKMSTREDIVRATIWAGELKEDELERARRGIVERQYSKGAYICHRGDPLDHWTGVAEGLIKISTISHSGKAMTFAGVTTGGWFGEGSVLKGEPRKYDVVALRDTRMILMTRATFMWFSKTAPASTAFSCVSSMNAWGNSSPRSNMTAS